jgi:hypothetical protein
MKVKSEAKPHDFGILNDRVVCCDYGTSGGRRRTESAKAVWR